MSVFQCYLTTKSGHFDSEDSLLTMNSDNKGCHKLTHNLATTLENMLTVSELWYFFSISFNGWSDLFLSP